MGTLVFLLGLTFLSTPFIVFGKFLNSDIDPINIIATLVASFPPEVIIHVGVLTMLGIFCLTIMLFV